MSLLTAAAFNILAHGGQLFVDFHHVSGAGAFSAFSDFKLDDIVFRQGFEALALDFGMMHKQIFGSAVRGDETISLLVAEPLYLTLGIQKLS